VKVNISDEPKLGADHKIEAVPTVKFLKDGQELETVVGLMDEDEIIEKISTYYYG
jgi:thioredoxin-like negative regulator of GroEL